MGKKVFSSARTSKAILALAVSLAFTPLALADDTDIFNNPLQSGLKPNVLLMIDNGANWSSNYTVEGVPSKQAAVSQAIYTVASNAAMVDKVRLGMMLFTQGNSPEGGKVVAAVDDFTTSRQGLFKCLVYNKVEVGGVPTCVPTNGLATESSNNSPIAKSFNEAYLYFKGSNYLAGKADGVAQTVGVKTGNGNNLDLGADPAAFRNSSSYLQPSSGNVCANNFIILIGTVNGTLAAGEDGEAKSLLAGHMGRQPTQVVLNPDGNGHNWGDEFAGFLSTADVVPDVEGQQSVMTYVIDVFDPAGNNNAPSQSARAYYKSVAAQGKGRYFTASNAEEIAAAITEILTEVQAVNSSFASASMPISMTAETQGTNENQVYIGMFRPDRNGRPRWMGNLKRYQYEWDSSLRVPFLADANGRAAYDPVTGFINESTVSYWTSSSSYWDQITGYTSVSDSPDGPIVEKGATGQRLRERSSERNVLTPCAAGSSSCSNGTALAALSLADTDLLNWLKGKDILNETGKGDPALPRPSIHGDVLHSRPVVLNYNRATATGSGEDIVVFYGSNDGLFKAIRGSNGEELWSMALPEQLPKLSALYNNATMVDGVAVKHPYFVDGSPTDYRITSTAENGKKYISTAWLFLSMRRGGDYLYALDVSSPSSPNYKWKIQGGAGDFAILGQTWSAPKVAKVRARMTSGENPVPKPVVFFGAGYDAAAEDYVPNNGGRPARTRGQGIYMVDADTGAKLWYGTATGMDFSVAGDLTLVNYSRSAEGYADRIYFADTGGNIWRANIGASDTSQWSITKIAALGGSCTPTRDADCRKFLYHPSVVIESDGSVSILIGSGDREHPHERTVQNRFFLIKDHGQSSPLTRSDLQQLTASTTTIDASLLANGWYFNLRTGEKVAGNALTMGGSTYFNTNTPPTPSINSCVSNLGVAREYAFNYKKPLLVVAYLREVNGEVVAGGGFPPPPVPMTLKFGDEYWSGAGGLKPHDLDVPQPGSRQKTFWAKDIDE